MKRFRNMPTAAMIVAVIALVLALGGTGFAAKKLLKLGAFSEGAKNKTVGVGKLTYVTTSVVDEADGFGPTAFKTALAQCPSGLRVIGGGVKSQKPELDFIVDSYPTTAGWTARVFAGGGMTETSTFTTTAICANSRAVTGAPPSS
jgi:hypothetical protein